MPSFFEKLKKGMGIELPPEEEIKTPEKVKAEKKITKKPQKESKSLVRQPKKLEIKTVTIEEKEDLPREEIEKPEIEEKPAETLVKASVKTEEEKEKWLPETEGELAIDVYQTEEELVIQSAIAGVKPENLDISLEGDVIIIKGVRGKPLEEEGNYFYQECYWGPFSRELILPLEVDPGRATAEMKNGILTIRIPKIEREKKKKIIVKG